MPEAVLREQRKLITALFADVVGSTALGERLDPEDVHEIIGDALACVIETAEAYGGHVKDLAGDGALVLFGAPVAHEDDPERAVSAGLEMIVRIQELADRLEERGLHGFAIRVGIETGEVVLGLMGTGGKVEYVATGDAVNTAARIQAAADPGTVLVGEETVRRVADRFTWTDPVGLDLKGKQTPTVVRTAVAARSTRASADRHAVDLVGRDAEIAALRSLIGRLDRGEQVAVAVTGEAGMGKSRLLDELASSLPDGTTTLRARCASYTDQIPYWPFRDVVLAGLGVEDASRLPGALQDALGDDPASLLPFIATLTGASSLDVGGRAASMSRASLRAGLLRTIGAIARARAAAGPVIVMVEDLQWADPSSLDLLGSLIRERPEGAPSAIVLTARPEPGHPSADLVSRLDQGHRVALGPLSRSDAATLVGRLLHEPVEEATMARLVEVGRGVPFTLVELVGALREAGSLRIDDGAWTLDPSADTQVPDSVERIIAARLDRLTPAQRELVDAACVIGHRFDLELLGAVAGETPDLATAVEELSAAGIWHDVETPAGSTFDSVLVQQTAYHALVRRRRAELHRRAARALEPRAAGQKGLASLVGRHHLGAGDPTAALDWLIAAAREAGGAQAAVEALRAYDEALSAAAEAGIDEDDARTVSLRIERGVLLVRRGSFADAEAELGDAASRARMIGDDALIGRAEAELGSLMAGAMDYRAALEHLERALASAERRGDAPARVAALSRTAIVDVNLLRLEDARTAGERALSIARATGDQVSVAAALDALKQVALQLGDRDGLERIAEELDPIHRWNQDLWLLQFVTFERGYVALGTARWDEADRLLHEALDICLRLDDRGNELLHRSMIAWLERCRGAPEAAAVALETLNARARDLDHVEWSAWTAHLLGCVKLDLGDAAGAEPILAAAVRDAERAGVRLHQVRSLGQLARCRVMLNRAEPAEGTALDALAILETVVCPPGTANLPGSDAVLGVAHVLTIRGEAERARVLVEPLAEAGRRFGWIEAAVGGDILLGRCAAASGDLELARALGDRAIAGAASAAFPLLERDAHRLLAEVLRQAGEDVAAAEASAAGDAVDDLLRADASDAKLATS